MSMARASAAMTAAWSSAGTCNGRAMMNKFQDGDSYEKMQFYYHPDHLGSSSYITNLDGEVVQHIEYVPFGEVFIEERNNIWNTPYLFNAKEFDEETGLYYYGARYYDPRLSLWTSVDPLSGIAPNYSGYRYCFDNPTKFVDLLGLFETRYQAKEYRAMNGIKGRIQKNEDGTYSINDYKNHISYAQGDDSGNMLGDHHKYDGVIESVLVTNKKNRFGLEICMILVILDLIYLPNMDMIGFQQVKKVKLYMKQDVL